MKYYVSSVKIEEFINNCYGYISDMEEECKTMHNIIYKANWKGNAFDAVSLKYSKIMEDIDKIPETLRQYVKFMEIVVKNYGEGTDKLRRELRGVMENIKL